jgi:hypothetical protein
MAWDSGLAGSELLHLLDSNGSVSHRALLIMHAIAASWLPSSWGECYNPVGAKALDRHL